MLAMGASEPIALNLLSCVQVKSLCEPFLKYSITVAENRQLFLM